MQTYRAWNSKGDQLPLVHAENAQTAAFIAGTRDVTALLNQGQDVIGVDITFIEAGVSIFVVGQLTVEYHAELA